MKQFKLYSYAYNALKHWITAKQLREQDLQEHIEVILEGYEMACEQFLKSVISRTEGLRRDHVHSHNVWRLAVDAELRGREKYATVLRRLGDYYLECRYESDDIESRQAILDYLSSESVLDLADELLYELYTLAQDIERTTAKPEKSALFDAPVKRLDLFNTK